ncbi:LacI family DNA-binding transcriptional regulator [Nocardioides sp. KR10-350]|uniref:LacI family DNA-binding transcriptional regulator n=1 Tax=Nocardioides cheoyonin TaxID=3156615 RepID=UPI0032B49F1E
MDTGRSPRGRVTIREVAEAAGVSVATVSKVLNDRYGVAGATSEKVRAVIAELGYESSLVARSLRNHRTNVIGILVADFEPFSTEVLKGAADAIRGTGFELVVYSAAGQAEERVGWERRHLNRVSGTLVDGAVLVTPTVTDIVTSSPIVAIDPHEGPTGLPTVDSDNLKGGRLATEHLLDLGHRRIAMLTGRPDLQSSRSREQGFREAHRAAGVPLDESLLCEGDYKPEVAAETARALLSRPDRPTAVFAANDGTAIATIQVAAELGLGVPGDLSVVGFDNIPEAAVRTPPLTTVEQPIREMGQRALQLLVHLIREESVDEQHVRLPTRLVVRGSTAPLA